MAPASPLNPDCAFCAKPLGERDTHLGRNTCAACGAPRPLAEDDDYFATLGVERRFSQDAAELERRFYALSRALHPDRFTLAGPAAQKLSLERMSLVNQAYETLRDPVARREYLLGLEGLKSERDGAKKGNIPMELAESWFEIQDLLAEDPERAAARLEGFAHDLRELQGEKDRELTELEREFDAAQDNRRPAAIGREHLEEVAEAVRERSYLTSMERDVGRIRERTRGGQRGAAN